MTMNKITYIIATAIILLSFSCSRFEYRKSLIVADSLTETDPQRAVAMLDSMAPMMAGAPKHEQMFHRLLQIKAADKSYIKHSSDSTILSLVEYYETKGDKTLLPEAYYYAGNIYRDLNDAPRALEYYQKAEESLLDDTDLKFKSKLHNQQGYLFLFQYQNNKAISHFKSAYEYERKNKDTTMMTYCLKNIAFAFGENKDQDSCLFYYQEAYKLAKNKKDSILVQDIMGQMASFYTKKKDYDKAKEYLMPSLASTNNNNKSAYYSIAANIYMGTEEYDSALYYCKELLKSGSIHAKQSASRRLAYIYLDKKDFPNAQKFLLLFKEQTDSVNKITAIESINRMNALYNYNLREKENIMLKAENIKKKSSLIIMIVIFFTILMLSAIYIYRNIQKQKLQIEKVKKLRKKLYEQSTEYIQRNNEKINALEQELKKTSNENHLLIEKLEEQRADLILANETAIRKQTRNETAKARIVATDIFKTIQDYIKKEKVVNGKEWKELDEVMNREIPDFKTNLYSYYNISPHEYHICMLIRLEFSPTDMAILLGCTTSAVSKARKRLQEKFFSDEGTPKDFDQFIKTL